jgi:ABC-type multidrug transport system fused ATPase/permease subunit
MHAYKNAAYTLITDRNSSELINLLGQQIEIYCNTFLLPFLYLFASLTTITAISALLFITNFLATTALLLFLGGFYCVYTLYIRKKMAALSKLRLRSGSSLNKGIKEFFQGYKEVRLLGKEDAFINQIKTVSGQLANANGKFAVFQAMPRYLLELTMVVFMLCLSLMLMFVTKDPASSLPLLGMFAAAGVRLMPLANEVSQYSGQIRFASSSFNALYDELEMLKEFNLSFKAQVASNVQPITFDKLQLENVNFRYPKASNNTLTDISLSVSAGQSIGIMGTTGSGKTTLINLLIGLLHPNSGKILINDQPIDTCYQKWLNQIAYIPQDIFILDGTLKENIIFGDSDFDFSEEKLHEAVKLASLDKVVAQLENGYETFVGENGIKLSGGQRQRVALARAFYHQRNVIVMDEATSALDNATEQEIINSIKQLHGLKTLIVIAHRLSTIEHCDVVYHIENGRIVQSGELNELVTAHS